METINIKGKDYIMVVERLKKFRQDHPNYSLATEIVHIDQAWVVMKAVIKNEDGRELAHGTAFEKANSNFINQTSYIENCETSAWGRALGNLGIGLDAHIRSADEMQNATNNQVTPENEMRAESKKKLAESGKSLATEDQISILQGISQAFIVAKRKRDSDWIKGQIESGMLTYDKAAEIIAKADTKLDSVETN